MPSHAPTPVSSPPHEDAYPLVTARPASPLTKTTTRRQQLLVLVCTRGFISPQPPLGPPAAFGDYPADSGSREECRPSSLALVAASPTLRAALQTVPPARMTSLGNSTTSYVSHAPVPPREVTVSHAREDAAAEWCSRLLDGAAGRGQDSRGPFGYPSYFSQRVLPSHPGPRALRVRHMEAVRDSGLPFLARSTVESAPPTSSSSSTPRVQPPPSSQQEQLQRPCNAVSRPAIQSELRALAQLRQSGIRVGHVTAVVEPLMARDGQTPGLGYGSCSGSAEEDCLHLFVDGDGLGSDSEVPVSFAHSLWWWLRGKGGCPVGLPRGAGQPLHGVALHLSHVSVGVAGRLCRQVCEGGFPLTRLHMHGLLPDGPIVDAHAYDPQVGGVSALWSQLLPAMVRDLEELFLDSVAAAALPDWPSSLLPHCHALRRLIILAVPGGIGAAGSGAATALADGYDVSPADTPAGAALTPGLLLDGSGQSGDAVLEGISALGSAAASPPTTTVSREGPFRALCGRASCPRLEELSLESSRFLSRASVLAKCKLLCSLNLSWTDVTDDELEQLLPVLPFLSELHLDWCCYVRHADRAICLRPNSGSVDPALLHTPGSHHREGSGACHAAVSGLRVLSFSGITGMDDDSLAAIVEHTRGSLQEMNVYGCRGVTSIAPLAQCTGLQHVTLPDGSVLNAGSRSVAASGLHGLLEVASVVAPFLARLQVHASAAGARGRNAFTTTQSGPEDSVARRTMAVTAAPPRSPMTGLLHALPFLDVLDLSTCGSQLERASLQSPCSFPGRVLNVSGGVVRTAATLEALLSHDTGEGAREASVSRPGTARGRLSATLSSPSLDAAQRSRIEHLALRNTCVLPMRVAIPIIALHCAATLSTLAITNTNADSACLRLIAQQLPALAVLDLSHCRAVTDISPLLTSPVLERLILMDGVSTLHRRLLLWDRGTGVKGLLPMIGKLCPEFRTLRLRSAGNMTDADLGQLSSLGRWVTEVDLLGVKSVGPLAVAALSDARRTAALACGSLHKVNLSCTAITDADLSVLAAGMSKCLRELRLHGCLRLENVDSLSHCCRLRVLKLSHTAVKADTLFRTLTRLPYLVELDIRNVATITDLSPLTFSFPPDDPEALVAGAGAGRTAARRSSSLSSHASSSSLTSCGTRHDDVLSAVGLDRPTRSGSVDSRRSLDGGGATSDGEDGDSAGEGGSDIYGSSAALRMRAPEHTPAASVSWANPGVSQIDLQQLDPPRHQAGEEGGISGSPHSPAVQRSSETRKWPIVSPPPASLPVPPAALPQVWADEDPEGEEDEGRPLWRQPPASTSRSSSGTPSLSATSDGKGRCRSAKAAGALPLACAPAKCCVASRLQRVVFASNDSYLLSTACVSEVRPAALADEAQSRRQTPTTVYLKEGMRGLAALLSVMCPGLQSVAMERFAIHGRKQPQSPRCRGASDSKEGGEAGTAETKEQRRAARAAQDEGVLLAEWADMSRLLPDVAVSVGGQPL